MATMYVAYERDFPVCVGTAKEVAEYWGVREETVRWYARPAWKSRGPSEDRRIVVRVECDTCGE